jgi:hypothetical protein
MSEGCFSPQYVDRLRAKLRVAEEEAQTSTARAERSEERELVCLRLLNSALPCVRISDGPTNALASRIDEVLRDWLPDGEKRP